MNVNDQSRVPVLLSKFVDGLTKASGAASAIVHEHQDPRFMAIRNKLNLIRDKAISIAIKASGITVQHVKH